jgi:hypothetical protein
MKLIKVVRANDGVHKYIAHFETDTGRVRKTGFGAAGMDDYTLTGDEEQRERYRVRHKKDLRTGDPYRAGYLSFYLLWGDSRSLLRNIKEYNRRFFG